MKNFKKNPLFFTLLYTLLLVFVAMLAYNVFLYISLSSAKTEYAKVVKQFTRVQSKDPSEQSVKASLANIEDVESKLDGLVKELSSVSSDIISEAPMKEGYLFVEDLRGTINKLRAGAQKKDILLNPQECFGYSSYYKSDATPPPNEAVAKLWKQSSVLSYIIGKLYASKLEEVPMQIDLVQREIFPEEASTAAPAATKSTSKFSRRTSTRKQSSSNQDTFAIDKLVSAKVDGSIDTFAFKFKFRTKTDVLRNFLNSLKDFDLMLVVRSVEVSAGMPIVEPEPTGDDHTPKKALSAEELSTRNMNKNNQPVINDNISEFTVTIEYVELSTQTAVDKPETEEDSD